MSEVTVRPARSDDVAEIVAMVHELAAYERAPQECRLTPDDLTAALFGPSPGVFATLAEVGAEPAGTAVWFPSFSTWTGRPGLHLEDVFVRPRFRRHGVGRALLTALAAVCVDRGYPRLEWKVLDWNTSAQDFYAGLGARPVDDWVTWRLAGDDLTALTGPAARRRA